MNEEVTIEVKPENITTQSVDLSAVVPEPPQTPHDMAKSDETRRGKFREWLLVGIVPKTGVPIWRYDWDMRQLNTKYPPAKLRALRAERGVGSSKKLFDKRNEN